MRGRDVWKDMRGRDKRPNNEVRDRSNIWRKRGRGDTERSSVVDPDPYNFPGYRYV
jgi:hypothetical protein